MAKREHIPRGEALNPDIKAHREAMAKVWLDKEVQENREFEKRRKENNKEFKEYTDFPTPNMKGSKKRRR